MSSSAAVSHRKRSKGGDPLAQLMGWLNCYVLQDNYQRPFLLGTRERRLRRRRRRRLLGLADFVVICWRRLRTLCEMILITKQVGRREREREGGRFAEQLPQSAATIESPLKFRDNRPQSLVTPSLCHCGVCSGAIYASSFNKHFSLMCCHYLSPDNKSFQRAVGFRWRQITNS